VLQLGQTLVVGNDGHPLDQVQQLDHHRQRDGQQQQHVDWQRTGRAAA
jgi:hypothetical protein